MKDGYHHTTANQGSPSWFRALYSQLGGYMASFHIATGSYVSLAGFILVGSLACGDGGEDAMEPENGTDPNIPPVTDGTWYRPAVTATWQWQLQGTVNTDYAVDVYDIDLFDSPTSLITALQAAGKRVICYFSAGSFEDFRPDAGLFRTQELGSPLGDFPDERWLDIRSSNVLAIMEARLDLAVTNGCDGVEPDNVDGFANATGFDLTSEDQLFFNRTIANKAHERGLSVALKNDLDQIPSLLAYFDFQVNEQCHEFDECSVAAAFVTAGKPVFNAEYQDELVNDAAARGRVCQSAAALNIRTLILPIDLDDSFRFSCDS